MGSSLCRVAGIDRVGRIWFVISHAQHCRGLCICELRFYVGNVGPNEVWNVEVFTCLAPCTKVLRGSLLRCKHCGTAYLRFDIRFGAMILKSSPSISEAKGG